MERAILEGNEAKRKLKQTWGSGTRHMLSCPQTFSQRTKSTMICRCWPMKQVEANIVLIHKIHNQFVD